MTLFDNFKLVYQSLMREHFAGINPLEEQIITDYIIMTIELCNQTISVQQNLSVTNSISKQTKFYNRLSRESHCPYPKPYILYNY